MKSNGQLNLRVLLVEDSAEDAELIIRKLRKADYKVVWERVETEATLIAALNNQWHVVICDYSLPTLSPERALEIVQGYSHFRNIGLPFIVISGAVSDDVAIGLLKKGANDFISKDNLDRLALAVRREVHAVEERSAELLRAELRIKESYDRTIEAWGKALELRDRYTRGHTTRVTDLVLRLAFTMNLMNGAFVNLNRGASLHDIGKMGIPDAVLLKQDILTLDERRIMEQHPVLAYEMLKDIPFLKEAIDIPYCHHERWNGSGYPQGLAGSEKPFPEGKGIPFAARMFAVVDVYDALTSDRPYRRSWSKAEAIAHLLEESGVLFDPEIVDTFVDMIGRG